MLHKLSVVVTVFNEEENVRPLVGQITSALKDLDYEMIFVDDGSTDGTVRVLKAVAHPRLKIIEFKRNYGQSLALMAGIDHAMGSTS